MSKISENLFFRLLTKNLWKSNKLFTIYYVSLKIKEFKWEIFVYFKNSDKIYH